MRWTLNPRPPIPSLRNEWPDLLDWSTGVEPSKNEQVFLFVTYSGDDLGIVSAPKFMFLTDDLTVTSTAKETLQPRSSGPATLSSPPKEAVDLSWLANADPASSASSQNLRSLYKAIQQWLRNSDYTMVDALFRAADVPHLPAETLTALLRYSFAARQKLSNWSTLLVQVREELQKRRLDTAALLYGLVEEDSAQQADR
jgi:hypothetical protein